MEWTGLLRSIQPTLMGVAGMLLVATVVYFIARSFLKKTERENPAATEEFKAVRGWVRWGYGLVWVIAIVVVIAHLVVVASTDRVPRSNFDRTGVNERVEKLEKDAKSAKEGKTESK